MKLPLTLIISISIFCLFSCLKEKDINKSAVANVSFSLYDYKGISDTVITSVNYKSTLILKSDYTWTLVLGDVISFGTYSWVPITNQQAKIKFTTVQWSPFNTDLNLSVQVKSILETMDHCGYSLPPELTFLNFLDKSESSFLRTIKQ